MLVFAAMDKEGNDQNSNEMLTQIFADKVARIRKYMAGSGPHGQA